MSYRDQEQQENKVARVPFGGPQLKLQLSKEERQVFVDRGMVPRVINDQEGRIQRALSGGYKAVDPKYAKSWGGAALHSGNSDLGSAVSKIVSRGEPIIRAYLMEIKKEYYDEDQALKETRNMQVDEALAAGQAGGAKVENAYGDGVTYSH